MKPQTNPFLKPAVITIALAVFGTALWGSLSSYKSSMWRTIGGFNYPAIVTVAENIAFSHTLFSMIMGCSAFVLYSALYTADKVNNQV
jgi:hypothetical protein